jgi:hypothetical protein
MTLPRFCKICRLIMHYPDLKNQDHIDRDILFIGTGFCPNKHYEVTIHEYKDRTDVISEILLYQEYIVKLSHFEGFFYLYKDEKLVLIRGLSEFLEWIYKDSVLEKLDTLVNFL